MLGLWALLLGANLVRLTSAIDAQERWLGPALGVAVSAMGILLYLNAARPAGDRSDRGHGA